MVQPKRAFVRKIIDFAHFKAKVALLLLAFHSVEFVEVPVLVRKLGLRGWLDQCRGRYSCPGYCSPRMAVKTQS